MNIVDIIIGVLLLFGAYAGYKKGLFLEIIHTTSFFIALILAFNLMDWGTSILGSLMDQSEGLLNVLSFVLIFIAVILTLNLIGKGIKSLLDLTLLGSLDDFAGAILGIIKWGLMISIFLWVFALFEIRVSEDYAQGSFLLPYVQAIAPFLLDMLSILFPFINDLLEKGNDVIQGQEQMAFALNQSA